jgi:hypothetical protein
MPLAAHKLQCIVGELHGWPAMTYRRMQICVRGQAALPAVCTLTGTACNGTICRVQAVYVVTPEAFQWSLTARWVAAGNVH